jgi:hypothetical protein
MALSGEMKAADEKGKGLGLIRLPIDQHEKDTMAISEAVDPIFRQMFEKNIRETARHATDGAGRSTRHDCNLQEQVQYNSLRCVNDVEY